METAASTTSVLELEKLKLPSLDTDSLPVSSNKPWSYFGAVSSSSAEATLGATLPTETLITSEEAVIAAAASEALALAKAAVKFAKDAAMMVNHIKSTNSETSTSPVLPKLDTSISGSHHLAKKVGILDSKVAEIGLGPESDDPEPSAEELEFLEAQLSNSIAVTSNRQTEKRPGEVKQQRKQQPTLCL